METALAARYVTQPFVPDSAAKYLLHVSQSEYIAARYFSQTSQLDISARHLGKISLLDI